MDVKAEKPEIITTQEHLIDYFLDQQNPEGFNKYEIKKQLDQLKAEEKIEE